MDNRGNSPKYCQAQCLFWSVVGVTLYLCQDQLFIHWVLQIADSSKLFAERMAVFGFHLGSSPSRFVSLVSHNQALNLLQSYTLSCYITMQVTCIQCGFHAGECLTLCFHFSLLQIMWDHNILCNSTLVYFLCTWIYSWWHTVDSEKLPQTKSVKSDKYHGGFQLKGWATKERLLSERNCSV